MAGAHVLVEKPVTINRPTPGSSSPSPPTGAPSRLLVRWNYRPLLARAREMMQGTGVGPIEHVSIRMHRSPASYSRIWGLPESIAEAIRSSDRGPIRCSREAATPRRSSRTHWRGALDDRTAGAEVSAFMSAPLDAPVELHDAMILRFDDGRSACCRGPRATPTRLTPPRTTRHQRHRTRRAVRAQHRARPRPAAARRRRKRRSTSSCRWRIRLHRAAAGARRPDPRDRDVINQSPGELGARTVEILAAAYQSADSGQRASIAREEPSGQASQPRRLRFANHVPDRRAATAVTASRSRRTEDQS